MKYNTEPMEFKLHSLPAAQIDPAHQERDEVTLEVAREGIVLLKNEGNVCWGKSKD